MVTKRNGVTMKDYVDAGFRGIHEKLKELHDGQEELKKFMYKAIGALGVILFLAQLAIKYLPLLLQNGK